MENASKALLIAGAILIVIVLISIGVMIVRSGQDTAGGVQDTAASYLVEQFNTNFSAYQGTQRGSSVTGLLSKVASNNATNASGHVIAVTITNNGTATGANITAQTDASVITSTAAHIVSSAKYIVVMSTKGSGEKDTEDPDGYITHITITKE